MSDFLAEHKETVFLMPGQVVAVSGATLVSTVLGSCIAVTLHIPGKHVGAICHAMLPRNPHRADNALYVDSAIRVIHRTICRMANGRKPVVKMFGGAQVLHPGNYPDTRLSVGEQNTLVARETLDRLGLTVANMDVGGIQGRKLFFSTKTGDVYLRRISLSNCGAFSGEDV